MSELRNVWSRIEIADISQPTDRPHLAAFILPSAVDSLPAPSRSLSGLPKPPTAGRRNAISIIAVASRLIDARTGPRHAASAQRLAWTDSDDDFEGKVDADRWSTDKLSRRPTNSGACRQGTTGLATEASPSRGSASSTGASAATYACVSAGSGRPVARCCS